MDDVVTWTPITLVADCLAGRGVKLYVGDQIAASDDEMLRRLGITFVLNTAVNLDINYVDQTLDIEKDGRLRSFGFAPIRSAKVGLIDGEGNHPTLLLAACQVLDGMLHQYVPDKPKSYPMREMGNILVHCRGGRSRSVTVAALYLSKTFPGRWPTFDAAVDHIRKVRGLRPDEFEKAPSKGLRDSARQALAMIESGKWAFPHIG
jgi:hypothetical protein